MKTYGYLLLLFCFWGAFAQPARAQEQLSDKELVDALRQGGFNIYFRHAPTDWSHDDHVSAEGDWKSCSPEQMRQLSAEGRTVAQRIGKAIRRLDIPIGRVFSSEYCRARETARYMNLGPVQSTQTVMNMHAAGFLGGRDAVISRARRALSRPPRTGTNTVFVAHGNLMRAASGAYTGEAGAAIFAPSGDGDFRIVTLLAPKGWERLARQFGKGS